MARARLVSARGATMVLPASILGVMSSGITPSSAPFGPFTLTFWPSTLALTPCGTATGFLPMRDMVSLFTLSRSEHRAQDLAADVLIARVVVGHDALGRRQDRHAEPVVDARQGLDRGVDPPSRLRHPGNLADHRLAVEIFQLDLEFGAALSLFHPAIAADVAFALEPVPHPGP